MKCRHCRSELHLPFVDLGRAPFSNAYLTEEKVKVPEKRSPLRVWVCDRCWLVQTEDIVQVYELFDSEYAYFSAFSKSWLEHCERYVSEMVARFGLNPDSHVLDGGANDGYLLQYVKARNIPCTGVEPTESTAAAARGKGIPIVQDFFGTRLADLLAAENKQADLIFANNVLAHVPDINDFVAGFSILLKPRGIAVFEFPHLSKLVAENQFDTIYHEHFSYLSFTVVNRIFTSCGLTVFDVEEHPTHGGSLRVFAQLSEVHHFLISARVRELLQRESREGVENTEYYSGFQAKAEKVKNDFLRFLLEAKREHKSLAAYGAAAKGNTLMNYAGLRADQISFVAERNPAKQSKYMPGSHIPIVSENRLRETKPDYVVILPWNLKTEIIEQLDYVRSWGGRFVTAVPELRIES